MMRRWYEAFWWWWYRTTGRDCTQWIQTLVARGGSAGHRPNTVFVPPGAYHSGDPKLPTYATLRGPTDAPPAGPPA
jgi:hypothetical protein